MLQAFVLLAERTFRLSFGLIRSVVKVIAGHASGNVAPKPLASFEMCAAILLDTGIEY